MDIDFSDKNLLVISNGYPTPLYPLQPFVKGQVDELRKYFNEVYVISPQPYGYRRALRDYSYGNVRVYYPRFLHFPVEFYRKRLGDNFFKASLRVIKRENLKFDLIHAHFTWPSGYAGIKLKETYGVPLVVTTHGLHVTRVEYLLTRNAKYVWEGSDAIINVSQKCVALLEKFGVPVSKVYYVPNGVDLTLFYPMDLKDVRKKMGIPLDKKVIVSVGNLVEKKGYIYLIYAVKEMLKYRDDLLVYIVGSGPLYDALVREIKRLHLDNYIYLVGHKPHNKIPLWMNICDVFVLPSLVENFGVVNIEALACGKPVISTYNGGSEEIITSEDYGFLCPPRDSKCLAEKILMALDKEWDTRKIREYAEHFSWSSVAIQILKIYNELLG